MVNFKYIYNKLICKLKFTTELELTRKSRNQYENKYLDYGNFPEITNTELKLFQETWPMWNINKKDLTWARIYKKEWGFSPYIIGNWHTLVLRKMFNPYPQLSSFENKALCDVYFPEIPYPKAYIRRLNGVYYDERMNILSRKEAIDTLLLNTAYVIKPAFGTMQGNGVEVISKDKYQADYEKAISESIDRQKSDFIAQELLIQHPDIAKLNPTSLNCCRVTSIFIDGQYGSSTMIKIGKKGSNVDNWHSSYLCGVTPNGKLLNKAYDNHLNTVTKTDNGIEFGGTELPCFHEMIRLVEKFHKKYFPNCGVIGWDILIDKDNCPRIIEANLTTPGLVGEQLASGDFFKEFRDVICKQYN